MGQKINPTGFRLGVLNGWRSNWFTERDFAKYLDEDRVVRNHITRKLSHAGLSSIHLKKDQTKLTVDIFTARPGIVIGKSGSGGRRAAPRAEPAHGQADPGQHQRDQAPRARREAGRPVDRRAAREPGQLPPRHEARPHLRHALRRPGRQGPVRRPPGRHRDVPLRALLGRPRPAAHAARRHRLRLPRGQDHLRPHRREGLDQQGRGPARGRHRQPWPHRHGRGPAAAPSAPRPAPRWRRRPASRARTVAAATPRAPGAPPNADAEERQAPQAPPRSPPGPVEGQPRHPLR